MSSSFFKFGLEPQALAPHGFASAVKHDLDAWAPVVKASGFTAED